MPPMKSNRKRLSLGMLGALERSRMMKPRPPMVNRKLEARPSMMYWPFTLENTDGDQVPGKGPGTGAVAPVLKGRLPVGQKGHRSLVSVLIRHRTDTRGLNNDVVDDS